MKMGSLHDLFVDELRDLYSAEHQLVKALPKMAKAANSSELEETFSNHLEETRGQVSRLEQIFQSLGINARAKKCKAMEGLIEEGKERMNMDGDEAVLDAGLISAGQRIEHYEIAAYGCAKTFAHLLGYDEAARLLEETLEEENAADKKLTDVAESTINPEAMAGAGATQNSGRSQQGGESESESQDNE